MSADTLRTAAPYAHACRRAARLRQLARPRPVGRVVLNVVVYVAAFCACSRFCGCCRPR